MSSIAKSYPFLALLRYNTLCQSLAFQKMLKRSFHERPNPGALYMGYLIGIGSKDEVNPETYSVMSHLDRRWPQLVPLFRSQVALVSDAFGAALTESFLALEKDPDSTKAFLAGKTFSGTLLITDAKATVSYVLTYDGKGILSDYGVLWLDCLGSIMAYVVPGMEFISCNILPDEDGGMAPEPILRTGFGSMDVTGAGLIIAIQNFLLFCHFADVDVKFVARPGSREARRQAGDKDAYVNDTQFNVRHLTAHYYTTISRDESFGVRGHFRMQPFGTGRSERKLIYISPFTKNGYHRRADLLTGGEFGKGIKI